MIDNRQHTKPRQPIKEQAPITRQQVLDAAAHWRTLADNEDAAAAHEAACGQPRGDTSSHQARAALWRQVADELQAQAEGMG